MKLTGLAAMRCRFTSHAHKLESIDCRARIVLSAKSAAAMSSTHVWMTSGMRSVTRANRPSRLRTKIRNWCNVTGRF